MDKLKADLDDTMDNVLDILERAGETNLNRRPSEGWSVAQIVEHIIICGNGIPDTRTQPAERTKDEKVQALKDVFLNMNEKYKADPFLHPRNTDHEINRLRIDLAEMRKTLTDVVSQKDLELLCMDMELPGFGFLTRYEWISFVLFHTQRHTIQARHVLDKLPKLSG